MRLALRIAAPLLFVWAAGGCGRTGLADLLALSDTSSGNGGDGNAGSGASSGVANGGATASGGSGANGGVGAAGVGGTSVSSGVGGMSSGSSSMSNGVGGMSSGSSSMSNGVGGMSSSSGNGSGGMSSSSGNGSGGMSSSSGNGSGGMSNSSSNGSGGMATSSSSGSGGMSNSSSNGSGGMSNSSSSGSGGMATSSSTSSSSASSTGSGGPLEDCTNGGDDDGDGSVDCEDLDCTPGFECAPSVPLGWSGPVAFWEGPGNVQPPDCDASGFPNDAAFGGSGLVVDPTTCQGCDCGAPVGVACQVAQVGFYAASACMSPSGALTIAGDVCVAFVTGSTDPDSASWNTAPAAGGACFPDPDGFPDVPPPSWSFQALACGDGPAGGGCGNGACVPKPGLPFDEQLCIYKDGDFPCPAGPYSNKIFYFQDVLDTRDCTDCACGAPTGTSCVGTLKLYSDTQCTVDEVVISSVGSCGDLAPDPTPPPPPYQSLRSVRYEGDPSGSGSCAPSGGVATGDVMPSSPITFCCE